MSQSPIPNPRPKISTALVLLCFIVLPASAQQAALRGFVTDQSSGQALESVNVVLRDGAGRVRGAATTRDGLYLINRIAPGRYVMRVSFIGYQPYADTLDLAAREVRTFNIALRPAEAILDEVVVEHERAEEGVMARAGRQTVRSADIERIPTVDVSGDLASYLTTLPGFIAIGDRGGQLFIRGGEPTQNLLLLDGILLYQPFHILGFYSAFPADVLDRADIYAGGFGSKYGGRIGAVIDVTTRNGNTRIFSGAAALSPFLGSVQVEGPILRDRVSVLASVRQSLVEQAAARYVDAPLPFTFGDAFARLHGILGVGSRVTLTALQTHDRGTLAEDTGGAPPEEIRWQNQAVGARFLFLPRILSALVELHLSYSRLNNELGPGDAPTRVSTIENTYMALEASYPGRRVAVEAGSTLRLSALRSELGGLYQNVELRGTGIANWGSYLAFDFNLGRGLHIRPGVRLQFYRVRFQPYLEPRLRVEWARGRHQISAAAGLYQQEVVGLNDRRDAASVFTVWTNIPRPIPERAMLTGIEVLGEGRPQRAIHAVLGYRVQPAPWLDLSIEGYYKALETLFVAEWTAFPRLTTRLQPADGRVLGVDARLEVRRPNFYGFITYGLASTRYEAEQASLALWYGSETLHFRPPHDRRHQLNILASTTLWGFGLNARWAFGSGLPFSRAQGFDGFAVIDDIVKASEVPGSRRVIYERPFNGILPTYHRLDVSVDRTVSLGRADLTLQASMVNAYNRRNLFYLDIFTLRRVDQLPLIPSLGLKLAF